MPGPGIPRPPTDSPARLRSTRCSPNGEQPRRRRVSATEDGSGRYGIGMTACSTSTPGSPEPYEVIHLGGEAAAIVPMADLRRLRAVERYAPAEARDDAEAEATLAEHREWVAAGRPGAVSHEEAMAELLRGR